MQRKTSHLIAACRSALGCKYETSYIFVVVFKI